MMNELIKSFLFNLFFGWCCIVILIVVILFSALPVILLGRWLHCSDRAVLIGQGVWLLFVLAPVWFRLMPSGDK